MKPRRPLSLNVLNEAKGEGIGIRLNLRHGSGVALCGPSERSGTFRVPQGLPSSLCGCEGFLRAAGDGFALGLSNRGHAMDKGRSQTTY